MNRTRKPVAEPAEIQDEPGWAERFQRGLRNLLNTPPKPRKPQEANPKGRPASKERAHKAKTRN